MPSYLNMKNLVVSKEYKDKFMMANATFQHQLVYNPSRRELIPLTDPTAIGTPNEYCYNIGKKLDNETAFQLALGNLDPFTLKVVDNWSPNGNASISFRFKNKSIILSSRVIQIVFGAYLKKT